MKAGFRNVSSRGNSMTLTTYRAEGEFWKLSTWGFGCVTSQHPGLGRGGGECCYSRRYITLSGFIAALWQGTAGTGIRYEPCKTCSFLQPWQTTACFLSKAFVKQRQLIIKKIHVSEENTNSTFRIRNKFTACLFNWPVCSSTLNTDQWVLQVMLLYACSFIVEVSCHCFTLHFSAYMAIFRCVVCYYSHILEGICFAVFFCILHVVTLLYVSICGVG
jgi:hypothetical protein